MTAEQPPQAKPDQPQSRLGQLLLTSKPAQVGEITVLFLVPIAMIMAAQLLSSGSPGAQQLAVPVAILIMIALVWLGLRLRGQTWEHFGLTFRWGTRKSVVRTVLQSLVVLAGTLALFVAGAVVMQSIITQPEEADMSGYNSLQGNLPALVIVLLGSYITASFGEEFIYRGFLMNRIAELGSGSRAAWAWAVVLSSLAFGAAHYTWGFAGMVQTAFMGLALGASYLVVGRNLWVTILAHGYMDTMLMLQMYFGAGPSVTD